ncbi:MAG TPA: cyclic nucleotide-binding domain-containing protein [Burkholderiales bacterium]|nr:cyclic nucleotide-binding domain-containing protein [Burkholderiales bacterium]
MSQLGAELVGSIPLFAGLDVRDMEGIVRILQPMRFESGARIMRQGQAADGAFIVASGTTAVVTALPGGGETKVAELGAGSTLGEMALLESGTRTATVIARTPVAGYFIERDDFRMLLAQRNASAFNIQNRITRALCERLRELNGRIVAADAPENPALPLSGLTADARESRRRTCSFDYRAFLPLLPAFRRYSAAELDAFLRETEVLEIDRGQLLFQQDNPGDAAFVVVRGALEILHASEGLRRRIGVLGPGRLCGVLALIESRMHSMSAAARENSVLLEISKTAFDRLFAGHDRMAAKFQDAVNRELLQALVRTNNHLTRLISQARIRGGRRERQEADEMQRAIGAQECRSA